MLKNSSLRTSTYSQTVFLIKTSLGYAISAVGNFNMFNTTNICIEMLKSSFKMKRQKKDYNQKKGIFWNETDKLRFTYPTASHSPVGQ